MSSPAASVFSSWRRRRPSSLHSQNTQDEPQPLTLPSFSLPRAAQAATHNYQDGQQISSSLTSTGFREPKRSFIHGSVRENLAPVDSVQSARSVREDTAELASYFLSVKKEGDSPSFLSRPRAQSIQTRLERPTLEHEPESTAESSTSAIGRTPETIDEVPEPESPAPEPIDVGQPSEEGPSMLTTMLRRSPPDHNLFLSSKADQVHEENVLDSGDESDYEPMREPVIPVYRGHPELISSPGLAEEPTETAPLLSVLSHESRQGYGIGNGYVNGYGTGAGHEVDLESQKGEAPKPWARQVADSARHMKAQVSGTFRVVSDPKCWDRQALWQNLVVAPVACLPAVTVGLLLNILDALSYGMILFPLGNPIFSSLGSAGISIFYVSTIISQLTFSTGSVFKGGVGSELIEVVPFFHSMAATITDIVGEQNPDAVIATTITSYALSSMLTGTVFYLMGKFKFGYIVGFIPRHILIGCIGGVGWFLVATGFEVTARMDGSLNYDLDTLKRLVQADTAPLWTTPLVLAIILFYSQSKVTSKFFLPLYIIAIPVLFYLFVLSLGALQPDKLRSYGWIFEGPPDGEPWWFFYTLYKFDQVDWSAIAQCVPAMFALTFFGILHVPINVPALALNTGEDHADLNHELKLHGYSNFMSGMAGSIQNYLVYANTLFFMRSGGDSRLAGFELAALTFVMMVIGPSLIGFIPVMMVGVLIFDLGFELLLEAIWLPRKKLKRLEYLTVLAIVLIMGMYDFVVGIGVGILLAFVSLIFQASQVSAVRASYSGEVVGSTVRRNPTQQHYLRQVGRQINIIKLAGYLFFGTIASVEENIRAVIAEEAFKSRPIQFLIIDLWQVTGLDYSAGEVFNTISRLLNSKGIELVISGVDAEHSLGRSLRAVGLGEDGVEVKLLPELNSALEYCENELLKTLYANQEIARTLRTAPTASLDVPSAQNSGSLQPLDLLASSPRRSHLHEAARNSLNQMEVKRQPRWQSFKEPLRLMLQIFQDVSDRNEDFWFRAVRFFERREYAAGTVLFRRGERAEGFYLLESGILRGEYILPQGWFFESIVAGTTCGELPFFSETNRTATFVVERECVVWLMSKEAWGTLQREEPDVAQELLRISLKLTSERLSVITSYTLTMAG
ncbi:sulfate transporter family-domain-containing protein [Podospora appendiculata]|uniref:Sulfate transporter family-domain-containing protein n=1 Tax=Podospora appendiculata TaxID=314037 RepID=A0AAE0XKN0_9PEZI|nr:sulfate transporter family-domain-containing protein [Podospora appendiculata]